MAQLIYAIPIIFAGILCISCEVNVRRNESDIVACGEFNVCNLVYNPYWSINRVEKLCKCADGVFCPAIYTQNDPRSLPVNSRTQMKFCSSVSEIKKELPDCTSDSIAITVKTVYFMDQVKNVSAEVMCTCNLKPVYWMYHSRFGKGIPEDETLFEITDNYKCSGEMNTRKTSLLK